MLALESAVSFCVSEKILYAVQTNVQYTHNAGNVWNCIEHVISKFG